MPVNRLPPPGIPIPRSTQTQAAATDTAPSVSEFDMRLNKWLRAPSQSDEQRAMAAQALRNCIDGQTTELNLQGMKLSSLPPGIDRLNWLITLNVANNRLTELPDVFKQLTRLQSLNVADNQLSRLPDSLAQMPSLKTLDARINQLKHVPPDLMSSKSPFRQREILLEDNPLSELAERTLNVRCWMQQFAKDARQGRQQVSDKQLLRVFAPFLVYLKKHEAFAKPFYEIASTSINGPYGWAAHGLGRMEIAINIDRAERGELSLPEMIKLAREMAVLRRLEYEATRAVDAKFGKPQSTDSRESIRYGMRCLKTFTYFIKRVSEQTALPGDSLLPAYDSNVDKDREEVVDYLKNWVKAFDRQSTATDSNSIKQWLNELEKEFGSLAELVEQSKRVVPMSCGVEDSRYASSQDSPQFRLEEAIGHGVNSFLQNTDQMKQLVANIFLAEQLAISKPWSDQAHKQFPNESRSVTESVDRLRQLLASQELAQLPDQMRATINERLDWIEQLALPFDAARRALRDVIPKLQALRPVAANEAEPSDVDRAAKRPRLE